MIFIYMLGCSLHYYNAEASVSSVAPGPEPGEFYVASELYCGPLLFPKATPPGSWSPIGVVTITNCVTQYNKKGHPTTDCDNVADSATLGLNISNSNKFKVEKGNYFCGYYVLIGPEHDESGWTPAQN